MKFSLLLFWGVVCLLGVVVIIEDTHAEKDAMEDKKASDTAQIVAQRATFAGGCFWCLQPPFDKIDGVLDTSVGYAGGAVENPTYEQVSAGVTGHAEVIQILFDPAKVSYESLLEVFWKNIDPLDSRGQFCDKGSQYRSAIFYHDEQQKKAAQQSKETVLKQLNVKEVATEIVALTKYYNGEEYHQDYYKKSPLRYKTYRLGCGRDRRLEELWK